MTQPINAVTQRHVTARDPETPMTKEDGAPSRVLLVITNALANLVAVTLRHGHYETRDAVDESAIRALLRDWRPHLAIIDIDHHVGMINLVGGGLSKGGIPILAFTRRRDTSVKLNAYEQGADDIVEVPFTLDEIIARPYALLRRSRGLSVPLVPTITLGGQLQLDLIAQTVTLNGGGRLERPPRQQTPPQILAAAAGGGLTPANPLAHIRG